MNKKKKNKQTNKTEEKKNTILHRPCIYFPFADACFLEPFIIFNQFF